MTRCPAVRFLLACSLLATLVGCNSDPNARKQKYFESGQRYFAEGKYREAVIQYSNATQIDPRFAQAHFQLGETYLKVGDLNRAYQELIRSVELVPDNYQAHLDLANMLVTARNPDHSPVTNSFNQAKTHLDYLREKQPDSPETHEAWANYYAGLNNLAPAVQEIQAAIAVDPRRSESYLVLALLQIRQNLYDQAELNFKKAVEVDPKAINAQMALGGFYQSRNHYAEAEQQFRHAIEVAPKNPGPRAALVHVLVLEGKKDQVIPLLQQTRKDIPDNSEAYRMLGDFYFANGDIEKATEEYASLYIDHPKEPIVKKNYIQLLILKNRLDDATKLNDDILKASPRDSDALIFRGQIRMRQNDIPGAIEALQKALGDDPDSAQGHYQLGLAYDLHHEDDRAKPELEKAISLRPDLTDAQRALATLAARNGDIDSLMRYAQQIIAQAPGAADGYLWKGVAEIARRDFSAAQQDAQLALQRDPQNQIALTQLGNVHRFQKQYPEAERNFQQALDKDPANSEALSGLMNTYLAQNQIDKAIAAANTQIAKVPNNSNYYDLLGTALFDGKHDLAGAENALHKAIEIDKNNTDALEKLGKVQIQKGNIDQAIALYQQSIKDNPREVRFYILCGELYESKHNWDQAKAVYQQALAIVPDQPLALNNLAYLLLQQGGNLDVAFSMAQNARRGMPQSPNAADTLGWAYYQKGIYQAAINQFQEALRLGEKIGIPDDPVVHYHLGMAYEKAKQTALARQHLERAVKLSPNNEDAKKALSELRS